jgi:hypothetical protein
MSEWPLAIERLGLELEAALVRRRRLRLRRLRLLAIVVAAVLGIATAAVATTGFITEGVPVPSPSHAGKAAARPLPLEPLRAGDPAGGPAWGLRLAVAGPVVCQAVGQVVGGRIGVLRGRVFHALPPAYSESCARVPAAGAMVRWSQYPGPNVGRRGARTVVQGVAGPSVIAVRVGGGELTRRLPLSPRGGFIAVFSGLQGPRQLPVEVTLANGRTRSYR